MAPQKSRAKIRRVPDELWTGEGKAPPLSDVLSQVAGFLKAVGCTESLKTLSNEAEKKGAKFKIEADTVKSTSLIREGMAVAGFEPDLESSSEESDSESDRDSSSSVSDSEGSIAAGQKRKRVLTPASSKSASSNSASANASTKDASSDDESESSSDESERDSSSDESDDERPLNKRPKTQEKSDVEEARFERQPPVQQKLDIQEKEASASESSSSDSDSDSSSSNSESDSEKQSGNSTGASNKPSTSNANSSSNSKSSSAKSESDSDSSSSDSSSSDSDSSSNSDVPLRRSSSPKKKMARPKKEKRMVFSSIHPEQPMLERESSSETMQATSPVQLDASKVMKQDTLLVHDEEDGAKHIPATKENIKKLKKQQTPFSRIPADTKVDPRFASNEYVSYDYADKAYRDLSVTKGKGFTKEKNKKKRGSYRGGMIDTAPKAIKFED